MNRFRIFNWTILGLVCYVAALPAVGWVMRFFLPQLWKCAYKTMTGRPCPFCGTTGDLARFWRGEFEFRNPMTPFLILFLVVELAWRIALLCRRRYPPVLIYGDLLFHVVLLLLFAGGYLWVHMNSCP